MFWWQCLYSVLSNTVYLKYANDSHIIHCSLRPIHLITESSPTLFLRVVLGSQQN